LRRSCLPAGIAACCGISVAAHERATRLDRTSGQREHTFFVLGDYLRADKPSDRGHREALGITLACAGHPDASAPRDRDERYANTPFGHGNGLVPGPCVVRAAVDELVASGFRDPEGLFYQLSAFARRGPRSRRRDLAEVVNRGSIHETFMRHSWLDPLRTRQDFNAVLANAERRHHEPAWRL
jgi:hypothetical protein